jgi:presenilin 1
MPEASAADDNGPVTLDELLHSLNSFYVILRPVVVTMCLASLASIYITGTSMSDCAMSGQDMQAIGCGRPNYDMLASADTASMSTKFADAMKIGMGIIVMFTVMTFGIVLLYKFHCERCLVGGLACVSCLLLGVEGMMLWRTAIETYQWANVSRITFFFVLWNSAAVGVIAIFYQHGIPTFITQYYLVVTSVIMAWQLSGLPTWNAWTLLVLLAFYDLFAVLTPCGPLKWLIKVVSEDPDGRPLPGLLYEADVPEAQTVRPSAATPTPGSMDDEDEGTEVEEPSASMLAAGACSSSSGEGAADNVAIALEIKEYPDNEVKARLTQYYQEHNPQNVGEIDKILMAGGMFRRLAGDDVREWELYHVLDEKYGTTASTESEKALYQVAHKNYLQSLEPEDRSIKLGLGDFVFYSVLVAKASEEGFAPWAACFVVVLIGLGLTLGLLAIYGMALPALPISILLGFVYFFLSSMALVPMLNELANNPILI